MYIAYKHFAQRFPSPLSMEELKLSHQNHRRGRMCTSTLQRNPDIIHTVFIACKLVFYIDT